MLRGRVMKVASRWQGVRDETSVEAEAWLAFPDPVPGTGAMLELSKVDPEADFRFEDSSASASSCRWACRARSPMLAAKLSGTAQAEAFPP